MAISVHGRKRKTYDIKKLVIMKKKIAVVTFHRANNYGATLQAYALTFKLNQMGADAELLDYRAPVIEKLFHNFMPLTKSLKGIWVFLHHRFIRDASTYQAFASFRREVMQISSHSYRTSDELASTEKDYDKFVAGSDQIWNPDIFSESKLNQDYTYMLNFVQNRQKKCSYAASIGISELSADKSAKYSKYLSDFSQLSVREHKAVEMLESLLSRDILAVCDPVLLLNPLEWRRVEKPVNIPNKEYILVYSVGGGKTLLSYADELAKKEQCAVYTIQPPVVATASNNRKQLLTGIGPAEFLWLIRNARAVITSSFHGTAFSLLFQRPLHVVQETKKQSGNRNSRFDSLFRYFSIKDSQLEEKNCSAGRVISIAPPQHNNEALSISKSESLDFLSRIISEQ